MSPVAMPDSPPTRFSPFFDALRSAPTATGRSEILINLLVADILPTDAKGAADRLAREVSKAGPQSLRPVPTYRPADSH